MAAQTEVLVAECPTCGAETDVDAKQCPRCGEAFEIEPVLPAREDVGTSPKPKAGLREKLLFYAGVVLVMIGGPGIALGSWLHDALRIPFNEFTAFDVFGSVNRLVSAVGLIVLIVGIVLLILSLRMTRPSEPEYDLGVARES